MEPLVTMISRFCSGENSIRQTTGSKQNLDHRQRVLQKRCSLRPSTFAGSYNYSKNTVTKMSPQGFAPVHGSSVSKPRLGVQDVQKKAVAERERLGLNCSTKLVQSSLPLQAARRSTMRMELPDAGTAKPTLDARLCQGVVRGGAARFPEAELSNRASGPKPNPVVRGTLPEGPLCGRSGRSTRFFSCLII